MYRNPVLREGSPSFMKALGILILCAAIAPWMAWAQTEGTDAPVAGSEAVAPPLGEDTSAVAAETDAREGAEATIPITATLEAFIVRRGVDAEGNPTETLLTAETASPGDIIQYSAVYENVSEAPLAGLIMNGPVPSGTTFVSASQQIDTEAVFEVLISDEPWQELPAFKTIVDANGKEQRVEAVPSDYRQLRWRLDDSIAPEGVVTSIYRVRVNN